MSVLGIVPARGGSKGIRRKNLVPLRGQPLMTWTLAAARSAASLTRIVVSTDDDDIAREARARDMEVLMRPASLADDDTPVLDVLQHVIRELEHRERWRAEMVVLLQPTSPLRTARHIDAGVRLLRDSGADSVVSVVEVPHQFHPRSVLHLDGDRLVSYSGQTTVTRRQDKPILYGRNGPAVLATRRDVLLDGSLYGRDSRPLVMTAEESVDIDSVWDLELAAWCLARRDGTSASR